MECQLFASQKEWEKQSQYVQVQLILDRMKWHEGKVHSQVLWKSDFCWLEEKTWTVDEDDPFSSHLLLDLLLQES